jgi:broad specificity phosphatase PhoE
MGNPEGVMGDIAVERQIETLIVVRHGFFEGNAQADATGAEAERIVNAGRSRDDYDDYPLLREGARQALNARGHYGRIALAGVFPHIDACFYSPPKRTAQTADIFLGGLRPPIFEPDDGLRERDRDKFAYMPDEWAYAQPDYPHGQPFLTRRFGNGETILEVIDREQPTLLRADRVAAGGTVLFVVHAESMLSLRAEKTLGGMTEEQAHLPIIPGDSSNIKALQTSKYVVPAAMDVHTRVNPFSGERLPHMTYFRTLGSLGKEQFDSGWVKNWRMRDQ